MPSADLAKRRQNLSFELGVTPWSAALIRRSTSLASRGRLAAFRESACCRGSRPCNVFPDRRDPTVLSKSRRGARDFSMTCDALVAFVARDPENFARIGEIAFRPIELRNQSVRSRRIDFSELSVGAASDGPQIYR